MRRHFVIHLASGKEIRSKTDEVTDVEVEKIQTFFKEELSGSTGGGYFCADTERGWVIAWGRHVAAVEIVNGEGEEVYQFE